MYLKSIEVQGFKSFAHKQNFEFQNGITCIVGPNGSGKSNVGDAIRWVLGEQSAKQLRGGNMQDVIFAGTELRKPQSFATVSITLDNTDHVLDIDYDEVKVTRRLYRSGESEYLLNGSNVRLRDINELFYDTGIGKEGYSIIGQGRIDQIISGKQEEKRALIDEAAGIVKFKRRKAAALKKLENERANLLRVADILQELTKRLEPLRKQSEKAKIYIDKKQELKSLDINMYLIEKENAAEKITEIDEKYAVSEAQMKETRIELENTKTQYDEIETKLEEIEREIGLLHGRDEENNVYIQELTGHLNLLSEQINTLRDNAEANRSRSAQIASEVEKRKSEISENRREYDSLGTKLQGIKEERVNEESKLAKIENDLLKANSDSGNAKNEIINILNSRAQVKGKIQRYDTLSEQITLRSDEIARKEEALKSDIKSINEELSDIQNKKSRVDGEVTKLEVSRNKCTEEILSVKKKLEALEQDLNVKTGTYHMRSSRLESLKGIAEHYEGYGNAIQSVMACKDEYPGIHGVVADIIKTDKKYETAIETALGGNIRSIVTDDQHTAKSLISYLKRNKLGRVTFFPLNAMTAANREVTRSVFSEDGVIGLASEIVKYDKEYDELARYLLGRTVVIDTIENAIKVGNKYNHKLFMVTLEGDSFSPGGSMTGGAYKTKSNLLGRKREIEELKVSTRELEKELNTIKSEVSSNNSKLTSLDNNLKSVNETLQRLYIMRNTIEMQISQIMEKSDEIDRERTDLKSEREELKRQIEEIRTSTKGAADELNSSEELEKSINDSVSELDTRIEQLEADRNNQIKILENIRLEEAGMIQKNEYLTETLERLESELADFETEEAALGNVFENNKDILVQKKAEIEETKNKIEEARTKSTVNKEDADKFIAQKQQMKEEHKAFFEKRDELSESINMLDKEIIRLQLQKEKIQDSLQGQAAYIWEEYELTPSEADSLRNEELIDRAELKKEVQALRSAIRGLGEINVNAIEEYKEVLERHTFLSEQHNDLVKSEDSLIKIIGELDKGMRNQFNAKFSEINKEFDKAFKQLFGGGKGTLILEENVDVLEAEISIVSQPPGKKLQNMMQLSGGEKSLTAIALLFAIQNLKPSPFCLLDEIEAALDEANVTRFTSYLHKLKDNTQFIVITHRRGTMASADRLYGITMQEKGVSTLVSVNLVEEQLDA